MAHETRYVDENAEIGGYCYYITALCNGGETVPSNEYCATSGTGCEPPFDLDFSYTSNNRVQLDWTAPNNENITGYYVYRKTEETPFKRIKSVRTPSYKDNSAVAGTVYRYAVAAYYENIDCTSAYATDFYDSDKFYVEVDWSNVPKDLKAELNEEINVVGLSWRPAYQATSYEILRNGVKIIEIIMDETFYVDADLTFGETYCYQVIAHGEGFEEASNEVCVEMPEPPVLPCPAPYNLRYLYNHAPNDDDMIRLTWSINGEERWPDYFIMTVIDHLVGDTTNVTVSMEDNFLYQENINPNGMDKSYKIKAVYSDCESEYGLTAEGEDYIRFCNLSVEEQTNLVKLYPNPTNGQLTVEAEGMTTVSVYNHIGQCLMEKLATDDAFTFDMSGLPSGVYMLKVRTHSGTFMQKVIKM